MLFILREQCDRIRVRTEMSTHTVNVARVIIIISPLSSITNLKQYDSSI